MRASRRLANLEQVLCPRGVLGEEQYAKVDGPLEGVKVLDMTGVIAGPMSTMQLADMGAVVTKLEKADGVGDSYRQSGTFYRTDEGPVVSSSFATVS